MDVSLATESIVHFCIFIENKIDTEPIVEYIEKNNFQDLVTGLELIIGTTEWEPVEDEEDDPDRKDDCCYGPKIIPLVQALSGIEQIRLTR